MTLKEFQQSYGPEWAQVISSPAFAAALSLCRDEELQKVHILTDAEIESHGKVALAHLRGFLKYEFGLLGLHEKKELVFQQLDHEEYPDPISEAAEQAEQEREHEPAQSHFGPGTSLAGPSAHEQIFPPPKKRGRPPGKKKLPLKRKPRKIRK